MNGSAQPNPQPQGPTPQPQPSAPNNQGVNVPHPQGEQVQDFSASSQPPGSHLARLGAWGLFIILLVGVIMFALHYFDVIYLGEQLPFLPSTSLRTSPSRSGGDQKITEVSQNITNGTSWELGLGCPVSREFCENGKDVFKDGEYEGFGGNTPKDTQIIAAFDGDVIVTFATFPSEAEERAKILFLENNKGKTLARYIFKGNVLKDGTVKKGDVIASASGEPLAFYDGNIFIFSLSENHMQSIQNVETRKAPLEVRASWKKLTFEDFTTK